MENGFFRWLWRFNAVAIALTALGALTLMGYAFFEIASDFLRPRWAPEVLAVPEDSGNPAAPGGLEEKLSMGGLLPVAGTGLLRGDLTAEQNFDYGFSSKGTGWNTLNVLYVDPASGAQTWLLPQGHRLITAVTDIGRTERVGETNRTRVLATMFYIISEDSSGDGRLSASDSGSLMIAAADGSDLKVLAEGVTAPPQSGMLSEGEEFVVFKDGSGSHLLRLDPATRAIVGRTDLELPAGTQ